jgi:hypothetical protein
LTGVQATAETRWQMTAAGKRAAWGRRCCGIGRSFLWNFRSGDEYSEEAAEAVSLDGLCLRAQEGVGDSAAELGLWLGRQLPGDAFWGFNGATPQLEFLKGHMAGKATVMQGAEDAANSEKCWLNTPSL